MSNESYPLYRRRPPAPNEDERNNNPDYYAPKHTRQEKGYEKELDNAYVVPHNKFLLCKYKSQ